MSVFTVYDVTVATCTTSLVLLQMDALHTKMHCEAERLVQTEYEHRQYSNRVEIDHQQQVEQLTAELNKLRAQQSPRASFDGSVSNTRAV